MNNDVVSNMELLYNGRADGEVDVQCTSRFCIEFDTARRPERSKETAVLIDPTDSRLDRAFQGLPVCSSCRLMRIEYLTS